MSSIFDKSLFNIRHENNRILISAEEKEIIYANNPRVPITRPRINISFAVSHHLVPEDPQYGQQPLPRWSLDGCRAGGFVQVRFSRYLSHFSGGAVEAILSGLKIPFDLEKNPSLYGPLYWRTTTDSCDCSTHVDRPSDAPLGGLAGAAARVSEECGRIAGAAVAAGKVAAVRIHVDITKRTMVGAEWYRAKVVEPEEKWLRLTTAVHDGGESLQCAICFEDVSSGTHISSLPCSHRFHADCIVPWLRKARTCPLCRFRVVKS